MKPVPLAVRIRAEVPAVAVTGAMDPRTGTGFVGETASALLRKR